MKTFLDANIKLFAYYKSLGDKTLAQLSDEALFWTYSPDDNSIAKIVKHLWGNMRSRWTDFLTSDGEKEWRNRDAEFEMTAGTTRTQVVTQWEEGWACLFKALNELTPADLDQTIYIRNQGQSVTDAISRQVAHYAYHVGQIVFLGKMQLGAKWQSLSIPKGQSSTYNTEKFNKPKNIGHFADEFLQKQPQQLTITRVSNDDEVRQILALQSRNLKKNLSPEEVTSQGFVTVCHQYEVLRQMNLAEPSVIAKDGERVVGYCLAMPSAFKHDVPELFSLFDFLQTATYEGIALADANYIVMGQVCVDKDYRSLGLFDAMNLHLKDCLSNKYKYCVTDISNKNPRSLRAHARVGYQHLADFEDPETGEHWVTVIWVW